MIENPGDYTNFEADLFEITWCTVGDDTASKSYVMLPTAKIINIRDALKFATDWFEEINDDIIIIGVVEINRGGSNFFAVETKELPTAPPQP